MAAALGTALGADGAGAFAWAPPRARASAPAVPPRSTVVAAPPPPPPPGGDGSVGHVAPAAVAPVSPRVYPQDPRVGTESTSVDAGPVAVPTLTGAQSAAQIAAPRVSTQPAPGSQRVAVAAGLGSGSSGQWVRSSSSSRAAAAGQGQASHQSAAPIMIVSDRGSHTADFGRARSPVASLIGPQLGILGSGQLPRIS